MGICWKAEQRYLGRIGAPPTSHLTNSSPNNHPTFSQSTTMADMDDFHKLEPIFQSFHSIAQYLSNVGVSRNVLKNLLDAGMLTSLFLVNILIINSSGRGGSRL